MTDGLNAVRSNDTDGLNAVRSNELGTFILEHVGEIMVDLY